MAGESDEKCVKKTNTLVFTEPTGEKNDRKPLCKTSKPIQKPFVCRVKAKPIRICSGADMKKMVPPKTCECKRTKIRGGRGILGFIFFGLKTALAAGAVYVSYDLGVWGTIDQTQEIYRTFCSVTTVPQKRKVEKWSPPACEAERSLHHPSPFNQFSHCDASPIDLQENCAKWRTCWNFGVEQVFGALAGLPHNVINKFRAIHRSETSDVKDVKCTPYDQLSENEKVVNTYK